MIDKNLVENIIKEHIADSDLFLVEVIIRSGNVIQVEVDSDEGVSIEDCAKLSKYIESKFDREEEDFELEVGSAGVTSPFKIPRQYEKNLGNEVEVLTRPGQKYSGILTACDDKGFSISITKMVKLEGAKKKTAVEESFSFGYDDIKYTKYLIRFK